MSRSRSNPRSSRSPPPRKSSISHKDKDHNRKRKSSPNHSSTKGSSGVRSNLFIVNLTSSTSESEIKHLYNKYGEVTKCRLIKDHETGYNKYCFVTYATQPEAELALEKTNGMELDGKKLCVELSREGGAGKQDRKSSKFDR